MCSVRLHSMSQQTKDMDIGAGCAGQAVATGGTSMASGCTVPSRLPSGLPANQHDDRHLA